MGRYAALVAFVAAVIASIAALWRVGEPGCGCEPPTPALAVGAKDVWVTVHGGLERFNRRSGRKLGRVALPIRAPRRVAAGAGAVWVTGPKGLWRVDPRRETVRLVVPIRGGGWDVAVGFGAVWVLNDDGNRLLRVAPRSGRVEARIRLPAGTWSVTASPSGVWLADVGELDASHQPVGRGTVWRIDTARNTVSGPGIHVGRKPTGLSASGATVWVVNYRDSTISRIDLGTGRSLGRPTPVPRGPVGVAAAPGEVWVVSDGGAVVGLDPQSGKVVGLPIQLSGRPYGMALRDGELWVTSSEGPLLRRVFSAKRR